VSKKVSKKNPGSKEDRQPKSGDEKQYHKGYRLHKIGLCFCLLASLLIIAEGVVLALFSPTFYGAQLLPPWGGYIDLSLGTIMLIGFVIIAKLRSHKTGGTVGATAIGLCAIVSLILFGGGFYYVGFILGLTGSLLTTTGE
jgi:hypothetical protein